MYKGLEKPERLLDTASPIPRRSPRRATASRTTTSSLATPPGRREVFEKITSGAGWNAFGFIAAEAICSGWSNENSNCNAET
jgi:hypothetical protein